MRLSMPVRMIGFTITRFQRAIASAERIFDIMDAKSLVSDKEGAIDLQNIDGHIVFTDVWFGYDENNIVLKNINLDVKPGETIAILGATGSGKSSCIRVICQILDLPLYVFDLASLTNKELIEKWQECQQTQPCAVLFEDIDAIYDKRKLVNEEVGPSFDCLIKSAPTRLAQTSSCSTAAALKVSAAPTRTFFPCDEY
jgi:hypothetical protein